MAAHGLENLESRYSVQETTDRLEELLRSKGIKIFARLDQAAEAQAIGISMRPMELLIFGDPKRKGSNSGRGKGPLTASFFLGLLGR